MGGYTKLFSSLVTSSIWQESLETRVVWITMLALSDRHGQVDASVPGLANVARVTLEQCEEALRRFQEPDAYSRTEEHEGRRVRKVEGGWLILNYERYRNKLSEGERREYQRIKQAGYRRRKKALGHEAECAGAREAIAEGLAQAEVEEEVVEGKVLGESDRVRAEMLAKARAEGDEVTVRMLGG